MKNQNTKVDLPIEKKPIKVRLDYKTIITLSKMSSLKVWLKRFPDAQVMTS